MEFKELSPKKKAEHIWEYYKIPIIGAIMTIVIVCAMFNRLVLNPEPTNFCGIAIYGPHISVDTITSLENTLTSAVVPAENNEAVNIINFFFTEGKKEEDILQDQDMLNKFYTYLYAMELDIFIGTEEDLRNCISAEFLSPITDFLPNNKVEELTKKGLVLNGKITEDSDEQPFGIELSDSALFKQQNVLNDKKYYLGFIIIEGKKDKTASTALEILKE